MPKEDKLFQLIRSMTKSEKGFFKKFAAIHSRKGNNNYIKIFNAIDKQSIYDEQKLLKKFKKEGFVNHFAVTKKYLFDAILKGLKTYHAKNLHSHQVIQLKAEISILMDRMLYYEALKHIKKAKKIAYQIEAFPLLLELLESERTLFGIHILEDSIQEKKRVDQEITQILKKIENLSFYTDIYDQFYAYLRQYSNFASLAEQNKFAKLLAQPLLQDINHALSDKAKRSYWAIQATYATLVNDSKTSYKASLEVMKLWANNPEMVQEEQTYYFASICTHLNHLYRSKQLQEFQQWITQLQDFEPNTLNLQVAHFERCTLYKLALIELSQDFRQFDAFVDSFETTKVAYEGLLHLAEQRLILYNICHLYIQNQQYTQALNYAQQLCQLAAAEVQQDLQRFSYILLAICAHSLQKQDILEQAREQYQNHIQQLPQVHKYEQLIFEVLSTPPQQWSSYLTSIETLRKDPYEAAGFAYFDLAKWIEQYE